MTSDIRRHLGLAAAVALLVAACSSGGTATTARPAPGKACRRYAGLPSQGTGAKRAVSTPQ